MVIAGRTWDRLDPVSRDVLTRSAREPDRTTNFGPGSTQLYAVWSPRGAGTAGEVVTSPVPAGGPPSGDPPHREATVVLVHGGFWRAQWDRTHLYPLAAGLADAGYTVALPEYRRTGMPGGTWPGPGADLAAALAAIRTDESLPGPVVLVGHSAGGHLVVWLLHRREAVGVLGAVSLAGCLDLRMVGRLQLDDRAADDLMGSSDWLQQPYLGADPVDLGPPPAPVVALHGTADEQVPQAVTRSWFDQCGTPGRDRLHLLPGCDHFDLIDPQSPAWPQLLAAVAHLTEAAP